MILYKLLTSRMLAGLRQHGNFPLPARAAGWTVQPDGTTFRSSPQVLPAPPPQLVRAPPPKSELFGFASVTQMLATSLLGY
jgi:hypothetical protein